MTSPLKVIHLERDDAGNILPFKTPAHSYTPIPIGTPMGIYRWTQYERISVALGTAKTFEQWQDFLSNHEKLLASDKGFAEIRLQAILEVNSVRRSMIEMSQARFSMGFYMGTVLIVQDGDPSPLEWSIQKADAMIDDWAKHGVSEQDMLFFCLAMVVGFSAFYQREREKAKAQEVVLSAYTT